MKFITLFLALFLLISCDQKNKISVDTIITDATIYSVNNSFAEASAMAIDKGKIVAIGTNREIAKQYESKNTIEAEGKFIYPGLIDAHCHFYSYGLSLQEADLRGTKSMGEIITRLKAFQKDKNPTFIVGNGWDQNDWKVKKYPTKADLDAAFPDIPIVLNRVDGHAIIVNSKALKLAGITKDTKAVGGQIEIANGEPTGILVDNPMELVFKIIPKPTRKIQIAALLDAEKVMFDYGLTTVNDAGLDPDIIHLMDSLQKAKVMKLNVYAMVTANQKNIDLYLKKGIYKTDNLNVRSFKMYGDGALGSRGACMHKPYSDKPDQYGALLAPVPELKEVARQIAASKFQLNTHAIGDSANTVILKIYGEVLAGTKDRRWKIEHAQVLREADFDYFKFGIIPSVQPTHATSDMYWAEDRLGKERLKNAYAYKKLLQKAGMVALGTDFPVEEVNPMLTFHAAVARKDSKEYPKGGFQMENALTRAETLRGMTIWAAFSNFEEKEKGSLEVGKWADFVMYDQDLMKVEENKIVKMKPTSTYLKGQKVK
ncbi:amidohydrolase [Flavobacterium yafengii]|jgi:predicted amidohydrolase YtcJ|uniref:amidohydrolase n=1 Tax=Flavobacterium yafengii TaxID=3041253 RepID=UPI0024A9C271|nr:amidohydrolase [Flavobacterium yafengii]MDI5898462.1 amidohydrolase [Flavobacterium yafengii]MDI6047462.1 amidohydrolase [Flavobacterium yafengii]